MSCFNNDEFAGDFDLLPLAAQIECGPVPEYPTSDDFQAAAMRADDNPARRWHCEAIRWRRSNPGRPLEQGLTDINRGTASSLYRVAHG